MLNQSIAKIFFQMAEYYEMNEVAFKPQAYERAARLIEDKENDLAGIYKEGGIKSLRQIKSIGQGLAEKIEEYIKTGRIKEYEKLKKACPVDLEHLTAIEGLGPKLIKVLYQSLKIKNLADLEKAAKVGQIEKLPHFGKKMQDKILQGIQYVKGGQSRRLLGSVLPLARKLEEKLSLQKGVIMAVTVGSVRRQKESVGDIDILVLIDNSIDNKNYLNDEKSKSVLVRTLTDRLMNYFCSMPEVERVLAKGKTKSSVHLYFGIDADLRVVAKESWGAALQYFTGSKDHNISLRQLARDKNLKLNEYGLFQIKKGKLKGKKEGKQIVGQNEEDIYNKLGLAYIEPEMRENIGEIEVAQKNNLPKLVKIKDVLGDLQMHSTWSDGINSIKELAEAAKKLGRKYIAITDHGGNLQVARALNNKNDIFAQWEEIDRLNKSLRGIKILKGIEVDIDEHGRPELPDDLLAGFDIVLGSIHLKLRLPKEAETQRFIAAMQNSHIDIIAHPTARKIQNREPMALDMEKIFKEAKKTGTILEINAFPERLDLKDEHIRQAILAKVKLSIGTDAHGLSHLSFLELGVAQARRGWAEKKDIINCLSFENLIAFLKKQKSI